MLLFYRKLCEDVKTEPSAGGTEVCVKKEETLELNIFNHGERHSNGPEVLSIKEEETDNEDCLCKTLEISNSLKTL